MRLSSMESSMEYTKYERARIIGTRALQLSMGAPLILKMTDDDLKRIRYNTIEIAKLEFEKDVIPITVRRPLPTRNTERRKPYILKETSEEETAQEKEE
jgi:DNA-directed RNA polymerase subunit K